MGSHHRSGRRPTPVVGVVVLVVLVALAVTIVIGFAGSGRDGAGPAPGASAATPVPAPPPLPAPVGVADRAACPPQVVACVDLRTQQSWLQRDGAVVYGPVRFLPGHDTGRVPPGPSSSATPTGLFHVQRKKANEVSREFHEPMPHAVYFAPGGIAFHQGSLDGSSHGCLHLGPADASAYFDRLEVGDQVLVFS